MYTTLQRVREIESEILLIYIYIYNYIYTKQYSIYTLIYAERERGNNIPAVCHRHAYERTDQCMSSDAAMCDSAD